jgi:tetratricopeptide (TPR) repeat protein
MALSVYNSSGYCGGTYQNAYFGIYSIGSTFNVYLYDQYQNTSITNNRYGVFAWGNTNMHLYKNIPTAYIELCGNTYYEYSARYGAFIRATNCSYPPGGEYPRIELMGGTVIIEGQLTCSGFLKSSNDEGNANQRANQDATLKDDPVSKEFRAVDKNYSDLTNRMYAEITANGFSAKDKFRTDYKSVIDGFKSFIKNNPESILSGSSLTTIVHGFKQLDDFETMRTYLQDIIGNTKLKKNRGIHGIAKRFMMDYYCYQKDFDNAIKTADEILRDKTSSDSSLISDVLYAKGLIYAHDVDKPIEAVACFSSIIDSYPDNPLVYLTENEMSLLGYKAEKINKETAKVVDNTDFSISNYPNPFNPTTVISFKLSATSQVSLRVYDMLGREVATLVDGVKEAGSYSATFDGEKLASGVYIIRLVARSEEGKPFVQTEKMLLTK